jgi:hypothetical protein
VTTVAGVVATPTPAPAALAVAANGVGSTSTVLRFASVRITAGGGSSATGSFMKSATRSAGVKFSVCFSVLFAASRSALIAALVSAFNLARSARICRHDLKRSGILPTKAKRVLIALTMIS